MDDVRPHVAEAAVYVVPLRVGGGTRLKIFEALAMGKAVVSTSVGAEGLPLTPGEHFLQADSPDDFARAVLASWRTRPAPCARRGRPPPRGGALLVGADRAPVRAARARRWPRAMRVSVFGLGYVGCVTAACLARAGHDVIGVDLNRDKVTMISGGTSPLVEPGLGELLREVVGAGRLRATTSAAEAVSGVGPGPDLRRHAEPGERPARHDRRPARGRADRPGAAGAAEALHRRAPEHRPARHDRVRA